MHGFKSVPGFLDDDADQMNHSVAALHGRIQTVPRDDVARNVLNIAFREGALPGTRTQQRTYTMAFGQQSGDHVFADETRAAGEEDSHREMVTVVCPPQANRQTLIRAGLSRANVIQTLFFLCPCGSRVAITIRPRTGSSSTFPSNRRWTRRSKNVEPTSATTLMWRCR